MTIFEYGYIRYLGSTIKAQYRYNSLNNQDTGGQSECLKVDLNYYKTFGDDKLRIIKKYGSLNGYHFIVFIPKLNEYIDIEFVKYNTKE
jgi:hypothetical protein